VPREIRRKLGVRAGDRLLFEEDGDGVRVTAVRKESPFKKYMGIGNPGIGKGRKGIQKWLRELRANWTANDHFARHKHHSGSLGRRRRAAPSSAGSIGRRAWPGAAGDLWCGLCGIARGARADRGVCRRVLRKKRASGWNGNLGESVAGCGSGLSELCGEAKEAQACGGAAHSSRFVIGAHASVAGTGY